MPSQSDIAGCIEAITISSPASFSFAHKAFETANADALIKSLTETIYDQCYCKKFNGHYQENVPATADSADFRSALSMANTTTERWSRNWMVEQVMPGGQYLVTKNNRYKLVYPGEFITAEYQPGLPQQGTRVSIYCQKEATTLQPAFYFAFSQEPADQQPLYTTLRFYWNLKSSGAVKLTGLLTSKLNNYSIPFSFKCLNSPGLYTRTDAMVLYITKPYYAITAQIISTIYPQIENELNDHTPLFTKELDKGLGLAEDPGTGESFGMMRCALVARGIYNAFQSGGGSNKEKMQQVENVFNEAGIVLTMPYLNAGSKDRYAYSN